MDITYLGHSAFKLRGKDAYLVTDPFDPKIVGLKFPQLEADIVTISHDHADHNKVDLVSGAKIVISEPGEYEVSGVSVIGYKSFHDDKKGEVRGINTIYVIEIDNLRIVHLGDLGHELSEKQVENLGNIDILFVPVGGDYTVGSDTAVSVVQAIEPRLVIPMHYSEADKNQQMFSKLEPVENFVTKMGLPVEKTDKLTVRKDTLSEEQKIIVFEKK